MTQREIRLALATVVVVIVGVTWTVVQGQLKQFSEFRARKDAALLEKRRQENLIQKRPDQIRQLQVVRGQLPRHPEGQDLKPEFARQVQSLAAQSGLQLTGLTPEPDEVLEELELYRSAVRCSWTGTGPQVVGFLYQLQQLGAVADVSDLRVRMRSGASEMLNGTFVIEFVYARIPQSEWNVEIDTDPQSPKDGATE